MALVNLIHETKMNGGFPHIHLWPYGLTLKGRKAVGSRHMLLCKLQFFFTFSLALLEDCL